MTNADAVEHVRRGNLLPKPQVGLPCHEETVDSSRRVSSCTVDFGNPCRYIRRRLAVVVETGQTQPEGVVLRGALQPGEQAKIVHSARRADNSPRRVRWRACAPDVGRSRWRTPARTRA